jgi:enoyl-[acyl-carrier protein] reductase I
MEAAGGGAILTMTYLGGERAVPHYNVMGVAKATLDSSVRYLAWDLGQKNIRVNAVLGGACADAGGALDRGLSDDGVDRRGALAAAPPDRSRRRGGRRRVPALGRRAQRDGTTLYVDSGYHAMGM